MGLPLLSLINWYGLFVPKRTPKDIIGQLNGAVVETLADRATQFRLAHL